MKTKAEWVVVAHGQAAHVVKAWQGQVLHTECGLRLPQWRPALSQDKKCVRCRRAILYRKVSET